MKKLFVITAIFSLFVFSGCELFSGKNTASADEKITENNVISEKNTEDKDINAGATVDSEKPVEIKTDTALDDAAENPVEVETNYEPQSVSVQQVQAPQVIESAESTLAKCLTEKGVKLYTSSTCPHCKAQKELFKDGLQFLDNIECVAMDGWSQQCKDAEITAVPTWVFANGERQVGTSPLDTLAQRAGCTYAPAEATANN